MKQVFFILLFEKLLMNHTSFYLQILMKLIILFYFIISLSDKVHAAGLRFNSIFFFSILAFFYFKRRYFSFLHNA